MDSQLNNYVILKHGKALRASDGTKDLYTLNAAVEMIKILERNIDRYASHSPYTIGKASTQ